MNVTIIETTGKVVGTFPVTLVCLNFDPTEQDYFAEAWRTAIEDNLVDAKSRGKYTFRFE